MPDDYDKIWCTPGLLFHEAKAQRDARVAVRNEENRKLANEVKGTVALELCPHLLKSCS